MREDRGWREPLVKLGLLATSLTLSLGVAEFALRAAGFSFQLMPERIEFGYPHPVAMRLAFIEDDELLWVVPDYDGKLRAYVRGEADILFVGDSCPLNGKYDAHLKAILDERHAGNGVTVGNLRVNGWSSYQGLIQMGRDVVKIRPKVVFIHYGWNDHWIGFGVEDKEAGRIKSLGAILPGTLHKTRLFQLVTRVLIGREISGDSKPNRVSPEDYRKNLAAMVRTARRSGITPVLVTAPTSHEPGQEPEYLATRWLRTLDELIPLHQQYIRITKEVAQDEQAPLCDMARAFERHPDRGAVEHFFTDDGIHTTGEGSAAAATVLYDCLRDFGLLSVIGVGEAD